MKTNKSHLIILALLPLALAGCGKTSSVPAEEAPAIRFAAPAQTRATIPVQDLSSVFEIRDWYDGGRYGTNPGDLGDAVSTSRYYINNTLRYGGSTWGYGNTANAGSYLWRQSSHLFFGWLKSNSMGTSSGFFGTASEDVSLSGTTLIIPATTITNAKAPFDFVYSEPVYRNATDGDFSPVQFTFKHLFARVAIGFQVTGNDEIVLQNVYLNEFANTKSATIAFEEGAAVTTTEEGRGYFTAMSDFNLSGYTKASVPIDVLAHTQTATKAFYNVWPLAETELPAIHLEYQLPGNSTIYQTEVSFPEGTAWEAGNQYSYTVAYMGNHLKIVGNVLPWDQTTTLLHENAAAEQPVLATWGGWDPSTCTFRPTGDDDHLEAIYNNMPVKGRFRIYSPTECTYTITMEGSHFTLAGGSGSISATDENADYKPGEEIDFFITPTNEAVSGDEATLSFKVEVSWEDGGTTLTRTYSLDSEIQKDGPLKVIMP